MTKMLIVEDEEYILDLLVTMFERISYLQIFYTRNGTEALEMIRTNTPDIVLLDAQLSKLDGYEVCKYIKKDPTMSRTRVLMISGMTQNSDLIKAKEAGVDDYITKPFTSNVLIEKVESLLKYV